MAKQKENSELETYTVVKSHPLLGYFTGDEAQLDPEFVKEHKLVEGGYVAKK